MLLEKILRREVLAVNGNEKWIQPCLDFALDVEQTNDPRRIIALLDGRDKLLTREYQRDLMAVRAAMEADGVKE
jgi:hypothetical protein